jgi:hypothetical protein
VIAVVQRGLVVCRLVEVEDAVKKKHRRRTEDEVERAGDGLKVVVPKIGGWLTVKPVVENLDWT